MTDMLRDGQAWLAEKLKMHASRLVIYQRDDAEAELPATIGRSFYEQDDGEGIVTRSQVRDFLIDTADLLLSPIGSLPKRGDWILETENGTTFTYELMSLGGEPAWRYSDPFRLKLRIHTKLIDTEEA